MLRPLIIGTGLGALSIAGAIGLALAHGTAQPLIDQSAATALAAPEAATALPRPVEATPAYAPAQDPVAPLATLAPVTTAPATSPLAVPTSPRPRARTDRADLIPDAQGPAETLPVTTRAAGQLQLLDFFLPAETAAPGTPSIAAEPWSIGAYR